MDDGDQPVVMAAISISTGTNLCILVAKEYIPCPYFVLFRLLIFEEEALTEILKNLAQLVSFYFKKNH